MVATGNRSQEAILTSGRKYTIIYTVEDTRKGKKPTMKDNNKNKTTTTTETTVSEEESLWAWDAYVESILDDLYGESGECTVGFDY